MKKSRIILGIMFPHPVPQIFASAVAAGVIGELIFKSGVLGDIGSGLVALFLESYAFCSLVLCLGITFWGEPEISKQEEEEIEKWLRRIFKK